MQVRQTLAAAAMVGMATARRRVAPAAAAGVQPLTAPWAACWRSLPSPRRCTPATPLPRHTCSISSEGLVAGRGRGLAPPLLTE